MWNTSLCSFGPQFGSGHWFMGWIFPLLFWGLILWAVVGLLKTLFAPRHSEQKQEDALVILKRRYANGEIDQKQFEEMRTALEE